MTVLIFGLVLYVMYLHHIMNHTPLSLIVCLTYLEESDYILL